MPPPLPVEYTAQFSTWQDWLKSPYVLVTLGAIAALVVIVVTKHKRR